MAYEQRCRLLSETSVNVAKNTSVVTIAFEFRRTDYSYWGYNGYGTAYWYINCAGQSTGNRYFSFDWNIPQNQWKEVGRASFTIPHNADGSKSISFSGFVYFGDGVAPGSLSGSGSAKLTMIPRATMPTVSPTSQVMGESIVINLPRASSGFTHKLTYKFGTASGVISSSATTSATFLVPESFAEQIPNSEKGTGTITCQTYNGATLIGTKTVNFTAVVPDGIVPVINNVTIEEAVVGRAISGLYLQNKSQLRVVTDAQGTMGSTIAKYEVLVDGVIHSGADIISQIVTSHGNVPINVTVTDSRGRTASKSQNVEFEEYYNPTIISFAAARCNDAGVEDDEGTSVVLEINFRIAPVRQQNEKSYSVQVKRENSDVWTTILSGSLYEYNNSYKKYGNILDSDYSHVVRLVINDSFSETVAAVEIGTAFTLLDFRNTGRGMAIGKVSQKDALEISMDVEFQKNAEIITEEEGTPVRYNILERIKEFATNIKDIFSSIIQINKDLSDITALDTETFTTAPYVFIIERYLHHKKKRIKVHGTWNGSINGAPLVSSGFNYGVITNLSLIPAGKITGIKRIVSYNMRPVSGGGGMLFVGASDAVTNSQHNHIYTNPQFILTSAPRTCYFEWDIEIEVE